MDFREKLNSFFKIGETREARMDSANFLRPKQLRYQNVVEDRNRRIALVVGIAAVAVLEVFHLVGWI